MKPQTALQRILTAFAWLSMSLIATSSLLCSPVAGEDVPRGQAIYQKLCADCHGANGQGVEDYFPDPLAGDRSIVELTKVIADTMPEGEADKCTGEDATAVAKYIYDAFYSPLAQARVRPPRVDLQRLTNRQYENAVADLIGSFTGIGRVDDRRGLQAQYFNDRRFRRDKRVIERVDPTVNFDFGEGTPEEGKFEVEAFSMQWQGSLIVPETGEYEITVSTENGAKLYLNDYETPLIDAWVKSGYDTEYSKTIRLLGGRAYPLRLDYFKYKEKDASVRLLWKRPHHTQEVIAERYLTPSRVPMTYVVQTPFPPDDRSVGYVRGTAISKAWDQATTLAAIEVASAVSDHAFRLAKTKRDAGDADQKLRAFCQQFIERAFRRPLSEAQRKVYIDRQFEEAPDAKAAVKRVVLLTLKSPRFLLREPGATNDAWDVASRLAFELWDSIPDDELRRAASDGRLATPQQVTQQARRMVRDFRTKAKLQEFLQFWLKMEHIADVSKDPEAFPDFSPELLSDLRTSLELTLEDVASSEKPSLIPLLVGKETFLNDRLAEVYGVKLPEGEGFRKVVFEADRRSGVLSHPFVLSGFAYHKDSSPIHRGVFTFQKVLGRMIRPPADANFEPLSSAMHPNLTTRERTVMQTSPEACHACHKMINAVGFPLEHFDAIGRFRDKDSGKPVDATGSYLTRQGKEVTFDGVQEMAAFFADSEEVHTAFADQLFKHMVKQPVRAYGVDLPEQLGKSFRESDFNINELLVTIVTASSQPPARPVAAN
ncbi:MAG: DUF1592 domain-containing protein [Planctomycetota bacterium]|jgi:mono/diheme cytochrome c family protein